jgi:membrane-associated protease RseP (regulator of RpoE activity)
MSEKLLYPEATSSDGPVNEDMIERLRQAVSQVFAITSLTRQPSARVSARFDGTLLVDSDQAYAQLDAAFAPLGHTPVFRQEKDAPVILAMRGRFNPRPWPTWPNLVLLILTVLSLLSVGASIEMSQRNMPVNDLMDVYANLMLGWPYALSLILILGAHELGHFIAARRNNVPASWPYFIPLPYPISIFGTLGAVIIQRAPPKSARQAFDVGVAGPLAGMIFAVPILLIGLATSPVRPLPSDPYWLEGNSLLYALSKFIVFGRFLPGGGEDVFINQLAQAGWTGLFVTGLNLIPVGQLDGGHVIYTLFGERARRLYLPVLVIMFALALLVSEAWLLWVFLLLIFGRMYVPPLDALTRVDNRRRLIALLTLAIFVLVFVPNPMQVVMPPSSRPFFPSV